MITSLPVHYENSPAHGVGSPSTYARLVAPTFTFRVGAISMLAMKYNTSQLLFISAVLELWKKGLNTDEIARTLDEPENVIERRLHEGLEIEKDNERAEKSGVKDQRED